MPALFFPNMNALRLALASGLVPAELARAPAAAGLDSHGRLWLGLPELPARECLAALTRLGVQALGETGVPLAPVGCWAELLPLRPAPEVPTGVVLFTVPHRLLARFLARLRRQSHFPVGVCLRETEPVAWVTTTSPPAVLLRETCETGSAVEAFAEQVPGVWVRCGWEHLVADLFVIPDGHVLLVRPPTEVVAAAGVIPLPRSDELSLGTRKSIPFTPPRSPTVPVRLTLGTRHSPARENLWVLDAAGEDEFRAFCAAAEERALRRLEVAAVAAGGRMRLVVRGSGGKRAPAFLAVPAAGYAPEPRVGGLWVPTGRELRPPLRVRELAQVLRLARDRVVWLEATADGGVVPHSVPVSAFRPVAVWIEYTPPEVVTLAVRPRANPFPLARFTVETEPVVPDEPETPPPVEVREPDAPMTLPREQPGWLRRTFQKLAALFPRPGTPEPPAIERPEPAPLPAGSARVERKLASPEALLHGPDWAARKRELESRLLRNLPHLGPAARADRWADLAGVYAATGNPADAAVCWMNAAWESRDPPEQWFERWFAAECRATKQVEDAGVLDRCLAEPWRPGVGRLVAAYSARAGFAPAPPPEFLAALPRILALLDRQFDELPVRAAWLARLAATRACAGDALGLARWRDRLLARLAERGPGLDLDEPSFLRFHGTASADRFQTAREWLVKVQKPVLEWIAEHVGGRFQREGLDAETDCTAAYAQLMLAWGLGCLGERSRANEWAARAHKALARAPRRADADPAVHAALADLFLHRVRDAQEGRPPRPGLSPDLQSRLDRLPEANVARYSVDKLREHSRVLEPVDRVRADRRLALKVFWGDDRLGERLYVLAERTEIALQADEAEALLRLCTANPTIDTLPRVVLTLLEIAPRLDAAVLVRLLDLLPTTFEWVEEYLAAGPWGDGERPFTLVQYRSRMLDTAFGTAAVLHGSGLEAAVAQVIRRLMALGDAARAPLAAVARVAFRALRRLGLRGEAGSLVRFLDAGGDRGSLRPERLGVAAGWYVAGDDEAGTRILDAAQDTLLRNRDTGARTRTPLAIAYAEALGFAPPRIALGRLAELFEKDGHGNSRLGRVDVMGSTDRYYTLQPLRLIDAVVRSVVTDEFTLGPAVRGWLDDDEFLIRGRIHRDLAAVLREQNLA